jgi:hypothetical protein
VPRFQRSTPAGAGAVSALRPDRKQWNQLPGKLRGRFGVLKPLSPDRLERRQLALVTGLGYALTWICCQPAGMAGGFGRWQSRASQCSFQRLVSNQSPPNESRNCQMVRLEQNLEGLLSVRFLADGSSPQLGAEQLLFAGVLESGQRPMHCSPDGRCVPRWPTTVVVASVAAASFDGRGLATTVPQTLLARGRCEVMRNRVRCQAQNDAGQSWSAQASL